jgi:tRNA pseudouridine38-40 synthase
MLIKNPLAWRRYVLSVQYHGGSFLGFSYQHAQEDCITPDGTDLRGLHSVEGRLRRALTSCMVKTQKNTADISFSSVHQASGSNETLLFDNIQVSSRTDRGVHALNNTLHVDLPGNTWEPMRLVNALNYYLKRQPVTYYDHNQLTVIAGNESVAPFDSATIYDKHHSNPPLISHASGVMNMRILRAKLAPEWMDNPYHETHDPSQPPQIPWNARFSATRRVYTYRILHPPHGSFDKSRQILSELSVPFEHDRAWLLRYPLDIRPMQEAAVHLQGTHDMTSFRNAQCQRSSPIVTLESIVIQQSKPITLHGLQSPYTVLHTHNDAGAASIDSLDNDCTQQLTTITVIGNAFVYRQVRNLVGCLVDVGRGRLSPAQVKDILHARNRQVAPQTAPPQGLFLVNVEHGGFVI